MFSGFTSLLPWSSTKQAIAGSADTDLDRGEENRPRIDDDRSSSVSSFRVVDSSASSISGVNRERDLPDLPQDEFGNDILAFEHDVGPSEESKTASVPGFIEAMDRSASRPPDFLRINPPPDPVLGQQDQDHFYSATSSQSSVFSDHRTRTPKRIRSTRSLGPGGIDSGLDILSPIYEPSSPDMRDFPVGQKEREAGEQPTCPKKTLAPSIHSTTSTIQERIMNLQATHPAFLKRSLKRSLSQTSSGSLHSEASGAPQLPPLHFRPAFTAIHMGILNSLSTPSPGPPSGTRNTTRPPKVVVPTRPPSSISNSPQHSQLSRSQPNTPQSLTTPRSHRFGSFDHPKKCSAIYEDSSSEKSFVTATSGDTEPGSGIIKLDMPSTACLVVYPEEQERTKEQPKNVEDPEQNGQEQSSNLNVVIPSPDQPQIERETVQHQTTSNFASDSRHRHDQAPSTVQKQNRTWTASVMSIASTTVRNESVMADDRVVEETATVVEDEGFIMERWMKTLFYSAPGDKAFFSMAKGGDRKQYPVSSTCILFWVGFIAPWCWLVGGWMPLGGASVLENETRCGKPKGKVSMDVDREMVPHGEDGTGLKKWILPDPSSSFKATTKAPSISSTTTLCLKEIEEAKLTATDPWVRRCRIASIVGGTILGLGLITMTIVVGVVKH